MTGYRDTWVFPSHTYLAPSYPSGNAHAWHRKDSDLLTFFNYLSNPVTPPPQVTHINVAFEAPQRGATAWRRVLNGKRALRLTPEEKEKYVMDLRGSVSSPPSFSLSFLVGLRFYVILSTHPPFLLSFLVALRFYVVLSSPSPFFARFLLVSSCTFTGEGRVCIVLCVWQSCCNGNKWKTRKVHLTDRSLIISFANRCASFCSPMAYQIPHRWYL